MFPVESGSFHGFFVMFSREFFTFHYHLKFVHLHDFFQGVL